MKFGLLRKEAYGNVSQMIHESLANITYKALEVNEEEMIKILSRKDFKGLNVTMPYKVQVIKYLDEISPLAKTIGSVNTIVNRSGRLIGYNTDYEGFYRTLKKFDIDASNKIVMILGSGGASLCIEKVLQDLHAKEVIIVSRRKTIKTITYDEVKLHSDVEILVNATPLGMSPHLDDDPLDLSELPMCNTIIDIIYNPLRTKLLQEGLKRGMKTVNGLYMLVAQAIRANELFLDVTYNEERYDDVYKQLLKELTSIVLIGPSFSGKTYLLKELGESLHKSVLDTDEQITLLEGKTIPRIFLEHGENYFRKMESNVIQQISGKQNQIIACGGGVVLNEKNMEYLKRNGVIVWLHRPIELIKMKNDRPLSQDIESYYQIRETRTPLYQKYADIVITNDDSKMTIINRIKEAFYEYFNY